jgi:hypothetical protein
MGIRVLAVEFRLQILRFHYEPCFERCFRDRCRYWLPHAQPEKAGDPTAPTRSAGNCAGLIPDAVPPDPLSEQETAVDYELARAASNQQIADRLMLSVETVKRGMLRHRLETERKQPYPTVISVEYLGLLSDEV